MNNKSFDIIIVGGNVVGSVAALAMEKLGLKIALIEKNAEPKFQENEPFRQRVSAISPTVQNFLDKLDIWQLLKRQQAVEKMLVWEKSLDHSCQFSNHQLLATIVENDYIQYHTWQKLKKTSVQIFHNTWQKIDWVEEEQEYHLTLNSNNTEQTILKTKLLIGADGSNSSIRQWHGILWQEKSYKQHCIVGNVQTEKHHQNTAWQRYHNGLAFAFLPLDDGSSSMAWYVPEKQSQNILNSDKENIKKIIYNDSGAMLGKIKKVGNLVAFPIKQGNAKKMIAQQSLLIGDAIRTVHPMAGQGINLGLQDVIVLSQLLENNVKRHLPVEDYKLLLKYERKRSEYLFIQKGMDICNWFFSQKTLQPLRPKLLDGLNQLKKPKDFLINIAMGHKTDLASK